jgi:hypothetical protein
MNAGLGFRDLKMLNGGKMQMIREMSQIYQLLIATK